VQAGADVDAALDNGNRTETAVEFWKRYADESERDVGYDCIAVLRQRGAAVPAGMLADAVRIANADLVDALLKGEIDIGQTDLYGNTLLHTVAAMFVCKPDEAMRVASALIELGVDVQATNSAGKAAEDVARATFGDWVLPESIAVKLDAVFGETGPVRTM
jgi:hypothetical protein